MEVSDLEPLVTPCGRLRSFPEEIEVPHRDVDSSFASNNLVEDSTDRYVTHLGTPKKSGSFTTTFEAYQSPTATLLKQDSFRDHDVEHALNSVISAKVIGHNIRQHVRHFTEHHCKVRSEHGAITWNGYEHSKTSAKDRRKAKTEGHFTPQHRPYAPIGGALEPAKKNRTEPVNEGASAIGKDVKSEKEEMLASSAVPLNESGFRVEIPSYGHRFLQIRMCDVSEVLNGRRVKLPMTLLIKMVDIVGNPDMYIVGDRQFHKVGIPSKESNVWKTKTFVEIKPLDPNYTAGTYYIRVSCGVDATTFILHATTQRYIPTIDQALLGPGHGYRPNEKEKREDVGKRMISQAIAQSDFRRRKGSSGNFPTSHVPMPSYFRPRSESPALPRSRVSGSSSPLMQGSLQKQPSRKHLPTMAKNVALARSVSKRLLGVDQAPRRPVSALGLTRMSVPASQESFEVAVERPKSALERAVDATFRSTMDKIKYDYKNLEVEEIRVQDFFAVLKPRKIEFTHVNQSKKQHELLFGLEPSDLHPEPHSDGMLSPPEWDTAPGPSRQGARGPLRGPRRGQTPGGFKEEVAALFGSVEPVTRKMREYEFVQLAVPVSQVSGCAVMADDGPGDRKLVYRRQGRPEEIKSGQAMTVTAGAQVPDGADAVVAAKNVKKKGLRLQDTSALSGDRSVPIVVSDIPVVGQNIRLEERPFYVGGGTYLPAREYCQLRFPQVLGDFDVLFRHFFTAHKEASDGQERGKAETAVQDEVAHVVLMGIDASPSRLLQCMKSDERKRLAQACKVHIVHSRTLLVTQGYNEEAHGPGARSMYLLLSDTKHGEERVGEMGLYLEDDERTRDYSDLAWDFFEDSDRKRRRFLGTDNAHGALFGERQLLFGDAWPCSLVGMTTCKVAEVPLQAVTEIIFSRPDLLNGGQWLDRESKFASSQNHSNLLGIMRAEEQVAVTKQPEDRRRASTLSLKSRRDFSAAPSAAASAVEQGGAGVEEDLRSMMRLDMELIRAETALRQYNAEMDELIAEGALNPEQLQEVLAERKEQELRAQARLKPCERGAMGDSLSGIVR